MDDSRYWLGFNLVTGIGPATLKRLIEHFGDVATAWRARLHELRAAGVSARAAENLQQIRAAVDLDRALQGVYDRGYTLLHWDSPGYPRYLLELTHPPPLLYVWGSIDKADTWTVAIVGTRRVTAYGRRVTREIVTGLVRNGITVVSGLARGVDAVAHEAALDSGGRTVAVLGSGLDRIYPPENRRLARRIAAPENGALLSEYPLGTKPDARNFPPRNRVISGLSLGTIVVEAGERSGALITARFALEQNRDVFAVPGSVHSVASHGPNKLIQDGARLIMSASDVLDELNLAARTEHKVVQLMLPESEAERKLLALLAGSPVHIDELTRQTGLAAAAVNSTLTMMELKGMIMQVGALHYVANR